MPRKIEDKEINDIRRILEIYNDHDLKTKLRMRKFIHGSNIFKEKEINSEEKV